jgi:hypothetical protein
MMATAAEQDWITERQLALFAPPDPLPATPRTRVDYLRIARWWHLEARRGYPSSDRSARYARNMRWAAGPGRGLS